MYRSGKSFLPVIKSSLMLSSFHPKSVMLPNSATSITVAGIFSLFFSVNWEAVEAVEAMVTGWAKALFSFRYMGVVKWTLLAACWFWNEVVTSDTAAAVVSILIFTFSSFCSMSKSDVLGLITFSALVMTSAKLGHLKATLYSHFNICEEFQKQYKIWSLSMWCNGAYWISLKKLHYTRKLDWSRDSANTIFFRLCVHKRKIL